MRAISSILVGALAFASFAHANCVSKTLRLTWEEGAPDGNSRNLIHVNGQFPGPTLRFDEGDDVEIVVLNDMPFNSSVHWHGLTMQGTPWSDGVPGLTQKPIDPGKSYVYRFKAEPAGTYWYHDHSRMQMLDGLYGAIQIRRPKSAPEPWSLISKDPEDIKAMNKAAQKPQMMMLSDWSHWTTEEFFNIEVETGLDIFCSDSILINGKGNVNCPGRDYLISQTNANLQRTFGDTYVSDKGCFPFNFATEDRWLNETRPDLLPAGLWEGCVPTEGSAEVITVDPAKKWVSLNFIAAVGYVAPLVAINNHTMWVYEVDGQLIEPIQTDTISLYTGERYAAMVQLNQEPGNYTMRIADNSLSQVISTNVTFQYKGGKDVGGGHSIVAYGGAQPEDTSTVNSLFYPPLHPYPALAPAAHADEEYRIFPDRLNHAWQYSQTGNVSYEQDRDAYAPLLYHPNSDDAKTPGLAIRTKNGSWVDFVIQVADTSRNPPQEESEFPHFMHKHSSKVWLIGHGDGVFNWSSVAEAIEQVPQNFNLVNPDYRDTFLTGFLGSNWIVIRYQVTNPGPWLFHCHIESHLAGGMAMVIMDGVDAWPTIPPEYYLNQKGYFENDGAAPQVVEKFCHKNPEWGPWGTHSSCECLSHN